MSGSLKCVVCGKPAVYVILGYSYCEECAKKEVKRIGRIVARLEEIKKMYEADET